MVDNGWWDKSPRERFYSTFKQWLYGIQYISIVSFKLQNASVYINKIQFFPFFFVHTFFKLLYRMFVMINKINISIDKLSSWIVFSSVILDSLNAYFGTSLEKPFKEIGKFYSKNHGANTVGYSENWNKVPFRILYPKLPQARN